MSYTNIYCSSWYLTPLYLFSVQPDTPVSLICWIYFAYSSGEEMVENIWKGEVHFQKKLEKWLDNLQSIPFEADQTKLLMTSWAS